MLKKILIIVLCISMIVPTAILEVQAKEYETKYLSIKRLNDGVAETYKVVTDGENVYIGVGDLIEIVEFDEKVIDKTNDTINQIVLTKEVDHHGYYQDINIFPPKKKIISAWYGEDEFSGCLNLEEGVFLDIVEIFNYLRVKAEVINNELLINIPVYSILDFMIYDYQSVLMNSVSQLDLLEAQESSFSSGFFDALSLACNNFDFRLLIPVWGPNELKDEQYIKAIQTLSEDDEVFYDTSTNEYMKNKLSERGFNGVLASGEDLVNVMSIGGESIETAEEILTTLENIPTEKLNTYMELINWNGESYDSFIEMRAWNKYARNISDAISLADIAVSAYETYVRAESWNQECLEDLEVLKNLDVDNYGDHKEFVKRIKKVAEECYQESLNKGEAVAEQTLKDVSTLILEKVVTESSVYGQVVDYFILAVNTGISVARCFGNVAEEMDKATLSYMVTCLINVAVASRIDAEVEYSQLNRANLHSSEIEEFRKSMRTTIKTNLRCWSYIYYLNCDGEWENTYKGKEVKNKIDKMNTFLTLLEESAQYDYALDEYDLITYSPERIVEILKAADMTLEEGTYRYSSGEFLAELQVTLVDGKKHCYWGEWYDYGHSASIEDFEFVWVDGQYDYEVTGWRTNQLLEVNLEIQEQAVIISIANTEGEMYFNQGEKGEKFKAEYKLVDGNNSVGDNMPVGSVVELSDYLDDDSVKRAANAIGDMEIMSNEEFKEYARNNNLIIGILADAPAEYNPEIINVYNQITDIVNSGNQSVTLFNVSIGDSYNDVINTLYKDVYKEMLQYYIFEQGNNVFEFWLGDATVIIATFDSERLVSYKYELRYTG